MTEIDTSTALSLWDEKKVEKELALPAGALKKDRMEGTGVGTMPYVRLSAGRIRYRAADVIAFVAERTVTPGQAAAHTGRKD